MARKRPSRDDKQKFYTVAEANAALPLVRRIVEDLTTLAHDLRDRHQRLAQLAEKGPGRVSPAHAEELQGMQDEWDRDKERLQDYVNELTALGVELKDYFMGLIDFRSKKDGREIYLCWKLGEPYVGHWHEIDAGFAGRKSLAPESASV